MDDSSPPLLRLASRLGRRAMPVLLGTFVLWQFWHLLVDNLTHMEETLVKMLRTARGNESPSATWQTLASTPGTERLLTEWVAPAEDAPETSLLTQKFKHERRIHRWYGQAAGQEQYWSLFAPNISEQSNFVAVQLRWDDPERPQPEWLDEGAAPGPTPRPSVLLLSDNEPSDVNRYFRVGRYRLRRYEGNIDASLTRRDRSADEWVKGWTSTIRSRVHRDGDCMHAYLRWRLYRHLAEHPDTPMPTQVVLLARTYTIPKPPGPEPWGWEFESQVPLCRWLPQGPIDRDSLPIERFLPETGTYRKIDK